MLFISLKDGLNDFRNIVVDMAFYNVNIFKGRKSNVKFVVKMSHS